MTNFSRDFLNHAGTICGALDADQIDRIATGLAAVRDGGGRLFILGVGGSAGNAGHAVNDFRKLCDVETYAPTDNVSELTISQSSPQKSRLRNLGWGSKASQ